MIRDARVLREGFVPREVRHRDGEVNDLANALQPLTRGDPVDTVVITGPAGAGKTCVSRYVVDRLREETLDVEAQYVNCWRNHTGYRAAYRVLDGLGKAVEIHRQSTPLDELVARLEAHDGPPCVVILDEADQLEAMDLVYDLHSLTGFAPVLIANREEELFARVDDRLRSRLRGSHRVAFDRYDLDELVAILEDRARWGLVEGAVTDDALATMADAAAGDARLAIGLLRNAARGAEDRDLDRITPETVHTVEPQGRAELRRKNLESLPPHQRTLYEIVDDHGPIAPGAVYDRYADRVEDPRTDRTVRTYLSKLVEYDLLEARGTTRDRTYVVVS
ncbi:MAG: orc1/cdc6 family replication initiation protein [Halobacteriales archaeon]|jgi:orc1/cdc6 family replication initiation protein